MRNAPKSSIPDAEAPGYPLASVDNALRLLTLLTARGALRIGEAADALGVAPSTAHRLLAMLRYRGFAVQDRHRSYRPGPALLDLAPSALRPPDLSVVAHDHLMALARATKETAHLMVLEGNGARFIDGVDGEQTLRVGTRVGMLLPAHVTSGGKAMLAELTPEELLALYPRGLPRTRPTALADLPGLQRELSAVRRRGYALNLEESEQGVTAIGACVRDGTQRAVAAVVVAGPAGRSSRQSLSALSDTLLRAARDISAQL